MRAALRDYLARHLDLDRDPLGGLVGLVDETDGPVDVAERHDPLPVRGSRWCGRARHVKILYVDTGAFIALIWSRDRAHGPMRDAFPSIRSDGARLVTCDPAIGETGTRLRYDAGLAATLTFHDLVQQAVMAGQLDVVESSTRLRSEAFELMGRFDGLSLSYADAVGVAVAKRHGATSVLGLVNDFRVLGFHLMPEPSAT